ncbi:hypothetical protein B0H14DRAFT_198398 [Mycena olivaceomarginata]|nr:hypothetical protein B0H14DRAFT_198398 [Mycena olivaceomarginata]
MHRPTITCMLAMKWFSSALRSNVTESLEVAPIYSFDSLRSPSMPPLNRQDSRPSIYSWWSDSNPGLRGPTINLHAAAKPLMRLMYYRQALDIIRKNRGSPLTSTVLETYSSYFPWDYVSPLRSRRVRSSIHLFFLILRQCLNRRILERGVVHAGYYETWRGTSPSHRPSWN